MTGQAGGAQAAGVAAAPRVHTPEEAAEILKVRKGWLERQAAARKIPFTMLGGCYRFSDRHLAEIVRMYEQIPTPRERPEPPSPRRNTTAKGTTAPNLMAPLRSRPRSGPRRVA